MYYQSKYTYFAAAEPPYIDKIYYKFENKTVCIIHVDEHWNMWGEIKDPFNIPVGLLYPKFEPLTQIECEFLLLKHLPPPHREDAKIRHNMKEIEYDKLIYQTRLITVLDSYWLAWSEDDRVEDYHPRYNEKIMEEYVNFLPDLGADEQWKEDSRPPGWMIEAFKAPDWFIKQCEEIEAKERAERNKHTRYTYGKEDMPEVDPETGLFKREQYKNVDSFEPNPEFLGKIQNLDENNKELYCDPELDELLKDIN